MAPSNAAATERAPARRPSRAMAETVALASLLVLALGLRLSGALEFWLNPDEGTAYAVAAAPGWVGFRDSVAANAHPPLYYLVLRGIVSLGVDPRWMRLPGLVAGCLAVLAFYGVTRRVAGARAGLVAAGLAAVAPGMVVLSAVARQYVPVVALLSGAAWLLLRYHQEGRRWDGVGGSLLLLAAALTHYSALLFVASLAIVLSAAAALRRVPPAAFARLGRALLPAGAAIALFAGLHVLPDLVGSEVQAGAQERFDRLLPSSPAELAMAVVGVHAYLFGPLWAGLTTVLFLLGVVTQAWRGRWLLPGMALAMLGVAALVSLLGLYPLGASRHSLPLALVLVPGVAVGVHWLLHQPPARALVAAAALALVGLPASPLAVLWRDASHRVTPETVVPQEVFERHAALLRRARTHPTVVVMDKQTYFTLLPLLGEVDVCLVLGDDCGDPVGRVPWQASTLLVGPTWAFSTRPLPTRGPHHIVGFLAEAARTYPDLGLAERSDGLLLFGGWGAPGYARLPALSARLDGPRSCFGAVERAPGGGSARIDVAACLDGARRWRARARG